MRMRKRLTPKRPSVLAPPARPRPRIVFDLAEGVGDLLFGELRLLHGPLLCRDRPKPQVFFSSWTPSFSGRTSGHSRVGEGGLDRAPAQAYSRSASRPTVRRHQ